MPLGLSQVITARLLMEGCYPSIPKLGLRPQSIISPDSEIIKATELCDIPRIQELFQFKRAHPNDRTPEDLTVFRVSPQANRNRPYHDAYPINDVF